jgi:hypothetical protein
MKLKTLVGGVVVVTAFGCNFDGPGQSVVPLPIVKEVALNEHATLGENNGTDDALDMSSVTVVSSSTEDLLADIGFFIDAEGRTIALSTVGLGTDVQATHQSWIQVLPGVFGSDADAPTDGWDQASVEVGVSYLVFTKMLRLQACGTDSHLYGKIAVDSVNTTTRRIYVRVLANTTCGGINLNIPPSN